MRDRSTTSVRTARWKGVLMAVGTVSLLMPAVARADAFDGYRLVEEFELPAGTDVLDVLGDGRIVALVGADLYFEDAVGSRNFTFYGTLPDFDNSPWGTAFLRVSPDGTKLAVGNNGGASGGNFKVGVFNVADLSGTWFVAGHFDAAWVDDDQLAITDGDFVNPSFVTVLDITSPDPNSPVNPTVVDGIGGASAGITFDPSGRLYTGNGWSAGGGSATGAVKAFDQASWAAVLTGGPVVDFEADGTLLVEILSASPLDFDPEGSLYAGGSGAGSDFAAMVRGSAVTGALGGGGPIDADDGEAVRRFDPDTSSSTNFYGVNHNDVTGELYVRQFGASTVFVYADVTPIPAVSDWGMIVMGLSVLVGGTVTFRARWIARVPVRWEKC